MSPSATPGAAGIPTDGGMARPAASAGLGPRPFGAIVRTTARALLGRRRTLVVLLFLAVPILLSLLARAVPGADARQEVVIALLDNLVVRVVLPLVALLVGTAVLGAEVDDGTIVFLLVNPVPRSEIIAAKLLVAEVVTLALLIPTTALSGAILVAGLDGVDSGIAVGFTVGVGVGAAVYVAIFLAMSVVTSRALVLGLGYILIWEGFLASLFAGTRNLSVREYTLSIAQAVSGVDITAGQAIALPVALAMSAVVSVVAVVIAVRRLGSFSVTGGG